MRFNKSLSGSEDVREFLMLYVGHFVLDWYVVLYTHQLLDWEQEQVRIKDMTSTEMN